MKVLVTGANGFLGSNFIFKLVKTGHQVYAFSHNTNNIKPILDKIKFTQAYTKNILDYKKDIINFAPDVVIHFGWSGGNKYSDVNQISQFFDNVEPSIKFLQFIKELPKIPKFIGIGSFSEYGNLTSKAIESIIENPINLYGLSKFTFKNYSKQLCSQGNIDWVWIRPCYIYGPKDVHTRLIPLVINKCLNNENIALDSCNKIIDYLYVSDFVDLMYELMLSSFTGVYNLCSGSEYKLKDVINKIHNLVKSSNKITFNSKQDRPLTSPYICGSNSKIIKKTNLIPQVSLEEGIIETIKYYKNK